MSNLITPDALKREQPSKSLFLVDWDNTLFSTDYLQACGFKFEEYFKSQDPLSKLNHILFTELRILEEELISFLEKAAEYGQIFIVTNGSLSWVNKCLTHFFPKLHEILESSLNATFISARDLYAHSYPSNPTMWKIKAFLNVFRERADDDIQNIISFGDSLIEREALFTVRKMLEINSFAKSVKFLGSGDVKKIERQLNLIKKNLSQLIREKRDVDLIIKLSQL